MIVARHTLAQAEGVPTLRRRSLLARIALRLKLKLRRVSRRRLRLSDAQMRERGIARFDIRMATKL
ncbi:hypothetical protein ACTZWW_12390 [Salinarimonas sp. NSM]|uniref:hypothetical protein n=1 Tax=Salinarimonas sp. NSM TaxID=3458003 RepID=UPI004036E469